MLRQEYLELREYKRVVRVDSDDENYNHLEDLPGCHKNLLDYEISDRDCGYYVVIRLGGIICDRPGHYHFFIRND